MSKAGSGSEIPDTEYQTAAQILAAARQKSGKSLEQIAGETRIVVRHLASLEAGDYAALPSSTYAFGFARNFAASVGADGNAVVALLREEMAAHRSQNSDNISVFEPGDPDRIPDRKLAWFSGIAVIILLVGVFLLVSNNGGASSDAEDESQTAEVSANAGPVKPKPAAADPKGQVELTALEDEIWVRLYDNEGEKRLAEKVLAKGEKLLVPAEAVDPRINTGRPDALSITIGGKAVAKLSEEAVTMGEEPISAKALLARGAAAPAEKAKSAQ